MSATASGFLAPSFVDVGLFRKGQPITMVLEGTVQKMLIGIIELAHSLLPHVTRAYTLWKDGPFVEFSR